MHFYQFTPEAESFYNGGELDLLAQNFTVPGLSPRFPQAHCTSEGDVCQVTVGEGGRRPLLCFHLIFDCHD